MARRSADHQDDAEDLGVVEDDDVMTDDQDAELDADPFAEEYDEVVEDSLEEDGLDDDPLATDTLTDRPTDDVDDLDEDGEKDPSVARAVLPAEVEFDEDEDERIVAAVTGEDDDADDVEGLRDGEFVCRSCYLAKRETQLADPERLLCRDCA